MSSGGRRNSSPGRTSTWESGFVHIRPKEGWKPKSGDQRKVPRLRMPVRCCSVFGATVPGSSMHRCGNVAPSPGASSRNAASLCPTLRPQGVKSVPSSAIPSAQISAHPEVRRRYPCCNPLQSSTLELNGGKEAERTGLSAFHQFKLSRLTALSRPRCEIIGNSFDPVDRSPAAPCRRALCSFGAPVHHSCTNRAPALTTDLLVSLSVTIYATLAFRKGLFLVLRCRLSPDSRSLAESSIASP